MRLPQPSSSLVVRLSFTRYLMRKLRRAERYEEENLVRGLANTLVASYQARGELDAHLGSVRADRDARNDRLVALVRRQRQEIGAPLPYQEARELYKRIYPEGIDWYVASPQGLRVKRYHQLIAAYEAFLAPGHPVLAQIPSLLDLLSQWQAAQSTCVDVLISLKMARSRVEHVICLWEQGLERLYHTLATELGKAQAERFFQPHASRKRGKSQSEAKLQALKLASGDKGKLDQPHPPPSLEAPKPYLSLAKAITYSDKDPT